MRLTDGQLEPFPAHHLDKHRELQLTAPLHLLGVRPLGRARATRRCRRAPVERASIWLAVSFSPSLPASGDVLTPIVIDMLARRRDHGQRPGSSASASVSPIVTSAMPGDGDDLTGSGVVRVDPVERFGHVQLRDLRTLDRPVGAAPGDLLALADVPCRTRHNAIRPT